MVSLTYHLQCSPTVVATSYRGKRQLHGLRLWTWRLICHVIH